MKTQNQSTQQFQVAKSYEGYSSKDIIEFTGTEQECKTYLQGCINFASRNGADLISQSSDSFSCANYDSNSATVTFEIEEA